ncbi:hypothetical protein ACH5RR_029948 [Cinchona calisaya]|uniref:GTD-binding domain-containing protein n=1 Tax=Cinchona calisaya TaxID=153742 RepID=A0ABD2YWH0_9GENT
MAANKFATMVHKNTNKITLILIYAILEWTLIVLLLLNSLFSYLIIKFAEYFGLKPPCLWCSRVDHFFEPSKTKNNMHRDLLCEVHASEISQLGYCTNHQKLVESQDMCEDCLSSRPEIRAKNLTSLPWMKRDGGDDDKVAVENAGEVNFKKCSCCDVEWDSTNIYSSYFLIKNSSWDVLEYSDEKTSLITEVKHDEMEKSRSDFNTDQCENGYVFGNKDESQMLSEFCDGFIVTEEEAEDGSVSEPISELKKTEQVVEKEKELIVKESGKKNMKDQSVQVSLEDDASVEILPQHLEFFFDYSGNILVPVDMIDSPTEEDQMINTNKDEDQTNDDHQEANKCRELNSEATAAISSPRTDKKPEYAVLESMEMEEDENSWVFQAVESHSPRDVFEHFSVTIPSPETGDFPAMPAAEEEEKRTDFPPVNVAFEDVPQVQVNETDAEVSIGTEIPDLDSTDDVQLEDTIGSCECTPEDPSSSSDCLHVDADHCTEDSFQRTIESQTLSVDLSELAISNQSSSFCPDLNGIEEDKVPDTPTSVDSLHNLHKKLLLLEKKDSGTEDSLDGSVMSEFESGDAVVTNEGLKTALRAERKALQDLYAELEEERSSSAVAANQTMAMINRLQEEKAQMQMEALQYQRMMDEQSEYDQEALQLLNELMVKREKEKQELEKELEIYRRKVLDYETKERLRILRKSKDGSARSGFSSTSCSNAEDSDGLSIDLNQEAKEDVSDYSHHEGSNHHNTPVDSVLNLEDSLADFEEERLSILEQLKVLEAKLLTLDDEEGNHLEDVRPLDCLHEENGVHLKGNGHLDGEANGHVNGNGFSKEMINRRITPPKGKNLLPIFDAMSDENVDVELNGFEHHANGVHDLDMRNLEVEEDKNMAIEEEVDHLYERLQALEADREFLKHCISSLKKGDKGIDLLQEILQHLRDLRNVELRVRNFSDGTIV